MMSAATVLSRLAVIRSNRRFKLPMFHLQSKFRELSSTNHLRPTSAHDVLGKEEGREFMSLYPDIARELINDLSKYDAKYAAPRFEKALNYNLPGGKKYRGITTVLTFKQLADKSELTEENIRLAQMLGWCTEMLQAAFIILDDIKDEGLTRRGQQCWHRVPGVGITAVVDAVMIQSGIHIILKKYFRNKECYPNLIELFEQIAFITVAGEFCDDMLIKQNVTSFTMEQFKVLASNKTAYYTFYLPVAAGMYMCGVKDPVIFQQVEIISHELGHFYQAQNDYWDCFVDPSITGKLGTDIEENKCTWLVLAFMERAKPEQIKVLQECYGQNDPIKIAKVKKLYEDVGMHEIFAKYAEESYLTSKESIRKLPDRIPHQIFYRILDKLHLRE